MAHFELIRKTRMTLPDTINVLGKDIRYTEADEDGDVWYYVDYMYRDDDGDMINGVRYVIQVLPEGYVRLEDEMGEITAESRRCGSEGEILDAIQWCVNHINELLSELKDVRLEC